MRGETVSFDEAISGVYYFMRLPRSLRLARNDDSAFI
ncbi:RND transporter [Rickettsia felis]|nr:RND transporter [Rickettsia felis]